jgi:hypothetical protein
MAGDQRSLAPLRGDKGLSPVGQQIYGLTLLHTGAISPHGSQTSSGAFGRAREAKYINLRD